MTSFVDNATHLLDFLLHLYAIWHKHIISIACQDKWMKVSRKRIVLDHRWLPKYTIGRSTEQGGEPEQQ
jgi:hypothetical protein